jgi:hypothetical protein
MQYDVWCRRYNTTLTNDKTISEKRRKREEKKKERRKPSSLSSSPSG